MSFTIIDQKLKVACCHLSDLTDLQKVHLGNEGLDSLSMFLDEDEGFLVLIEDHEGFEVYRDTALTYMKATPKKRAQYRKGIPKEYLDVMDLFDNAIELNRINRLIEQARNVRIDIEDRKVLNVIMKNFNQLRSVLTAYRYGYLGGKRER